MKKLVLMFAAVAAISFASCDGAQKPAENPADSTEATTDSAATDSAATDSAQTEAPADSAAQDSAK